MTPYERVKARVEFPFEHYPFQQESINTLAELPSLALYHDPGAGKTLTSIGIACHKLLFQGVKTVLIIMPPILITNWQRTLNKIKIDGEPPTVLAYRGSPDQRSKLKLDGHQFVLMSYVIFKNDNARINRELGWKSLFVVADEATALSNTKTHNFRYFRRFTMEQQLCLLTGTPLGSTPMQAYGLIKLVHPYAYKTLTQFASIHVAKVDFFKNPIEFGNLDLLQKNLMTNADRKLLTDVLTHVPPCSIDIIEYELDRKHYKLYKTLAEEELLRYSDGTQFDAASVQALWHSLQQLIINAKHFADDNADFPVAGIELVRQVLDEIAPGKLVVFSHYKMSNRLLREEFADVGAVGIWSEINPKAKQEAIDRFIEDPTCRMIHLHPESAGLGVDGLQRASNDCIFVEIPTSPRLFEQSRGRLFRDGQTKPVRCRLAVASGTLQVRSAKMLAEKQGLLNGIQGGLKDMKAAIFGN